MSSLSKQYRSLDALLADKAPDDDFKRRAEARGVSHEQLTELVGTLRNVETNKNFVPTLDEYVRVRVGKLTVPKGFLRHVELLAKFADVSEETVWQLLMIETCALYAERYENVVAVLNDTLRPDGGTDDGN